jgi:UDP-N-acetylglucosamine--N-acetylmuramyl-(pentapeptide) pyrophosphoryl-undecaprenol N-acetylglucosamine transferase
VTTLLVASGGGHLSELVRLRPRIPLEDPPTWVTWRTEQAELLLDGERVVYVREVAPRGYLSVVRNLPRAWRVLGGEGVDRVISTGSGIALSFLPIGKLRGVRAHYIESAARVHGPSLTGRILSTVPGTRLYTQHRGWASRRWRFAGSVYDGYEPRGDLSVDGPLKVAVSVGTLPFGFRRLIERLVAILPADAEVTCWQTGATSLEGLPVPGTPLVSLGELRRAFREANVVVLHAGVGTILEALDAGRRPIIAPRRREFGEHVDDHQLEIGRELAGRGLAVTRDPDDLALDDLLAAAGGRVISAGNLPPLDIG